VLGLTDAFIEKGRGKFITGMTDMHPGGDHIAALRGSERLAVDLIEAPEPVKRLLARMQGEYFRVYDLLYAQLRSAGLPTTTWLPAAAWGKYGVVSNDFSCMISRPMFEEFFLAGIIDECRFLPPVPKPMQSHPDCADLWSRPEAVGSLWVARRRSTDEAAGSAVLSTFQVLEVRPARRGKSVDERVDGQAKDDPEDLVFGLRQTLLGAQGDPLV